MTMSSKEGSLLKRFFVLLFPLCSLVLTAPALALEGISWDEVVEETARLTGLSKDVVELLYDEAFLSLRAQSRLRSPWKLYTFSPLLGITRQSWNFWTVPLMNCAHCHSRNLWIPLPLRSMSTEEVLRSSGTMCLLPKWMKPPTSAIVPCILRT